MRFIPPNLHELEEDRIWRHSKCLLVYLPPIPKPEPNDWKLDFQPGFPPLIYFDTVPCNYWTAVEEGGMPYMSGKHTFTSDEINWLNNLEPTLRDMITNRK